MVQPEPFMTIYPEVNLMTSLVMCQIMGTEQALKKLKAGKHDEAVTLWRRRDE